MDSYLKPLDVSYESRVGIFTSKSANITQHSCITFKDLLAFLCAKASWLRISGYALMRNFIKAGKIVVISKENSSQYVKRMATSPSIFRYF